jgi:DNA-binding HxlR family transcriptional regulator
MQEGTKMTLDTLPVTGSCHSDVEIFHVIGDKWTLGIIGTIWANSRRFNEIRRALPGISQRMLTRALRELERDGLVTRTVTPTVPVRVDYALTELGRSMGESARSLWHWGSENKTAVAAARRLYDKAHSVDA